MYTSTTPPIPTSTRAFNIFRTMFSFMTYQNPLLWQLLLGRKNPRADLEGPYYISGSPSMELCEGKAIMAPMSFMAHYRPFLLTIRVVSLEGKPLRGALLDWWQADGDGKYYFSEYTLRGRVSTNEDGYAEVLTIVPGEYGALGGMRTGHFHIHIYVPQATRGEVTFEGMTTQVYIKERNDTAVLDKDPLNICRKPRKDNMAQCWSLPSEGIDESRAFMGFPELAPDDTITIQRVHWWNDKLKEFGHPDLKIAAGALTEIPLMTRS